MEYVKEAMSATGHGLFFEYIPEPRKIKNPKLGNLGWKKGYGRISSFSMAVIYHTP